MSASPNSNPHHDCLVPRQRYDYAAALLRRVNARQVLELGLGTAGTLAAPLAAAMPGCRFLVVDDPEPSLAREGDVALANLSFAATVPPASRHDVIIAGEGLAQVSDPVDFLTWLRALLTPRGRVLLTMSNGCGWYAWAKAGAALLEVAGVSAVLRRLTRRTSSGPDQAAGLADSPQVNFFAFGELERVAAACGLYREDYQPCLPMIDRIGGPEAENGARPAAWPLTVARRLPPALVTHWMLVLAPGPLAPRAPDFPRGAYARTLARLAAASARHRRGEALAE